MYLIHIHRSTKIAVLGIFLACALMISNWGYERGFERVIRQAVAAGKGAAGISDVGKPVPGFQMLCDPVDYYGRLDQEWIGEQKDVRDAIVAKNSFDSSWLFLISYLIALISAVPAVWYFLLRRLKEVSNAIRGQA